MLSRDVSRAIRLLCSPKRGARMAAAALELVQELEARSALVGALADELVRVTRELAQANSDRQKEHDKRVQAQGSLTAVEERMARRTELLRRWVDAWPATNVSICSATQDELTTDQPAEQAERKAGE